MKGCLNILQGPQEFPGTPYPLLAGKPIAPHTHTHLTSILPMRCSYRLLVQQSEGTLSPPFPSHPCISWGGGVHWEGSGWATQNQQPLKNRVVWARPPACPFLLEGSSQHSGVSPRERGGGGVS